MVAIVLTVYGIETNDGDGYSCLIFVATVLTVYGIETFFPSLFAFVNDYCVATVLTIYGIETLLKSI